MLVIGYGSIGKRHCEVLETLGCTVFKVSRRKHIGREFFESIEDALLGKNINYVVIASETSKHLQDLIVLEKLNYSGKVLVEKPIFSNVNFVEKFANSENIYVGYNMRFNPLLTELREQIKNEQVISVCSYVGQYLPDWRPHLDYRDSYSSSRRAGGGVLRDLSHEIDYLVWLFGSMDNISAIGGKYSQLEIETEDIVSCICNFSKCYVGNFTLNYLDRDVSRFLIVNTDQGTYKLDFVSRTMRFNGLDTEYEFDRNHVYREMHQAIIENIGDSRLCKYNEGLNVSKLISKIEKTYKREKNV